MKYLCLICAETVLEDMAERAAAAHLQQYAALVDETRRSGHFIGANRLQPASTAQTIRVRDGKLSVTDGPWIETKEHLGGYYLIEANDMEEGSASPSRYRAPRSAAWKCGRWRKTGAPCRRCAENTFWRCRIGKSPFDYTSESTTMRYSDLSSQPRKEDHHADPTLSVFRRPLR